MDGYNRAHNIRATGENHGMRVNDIAKQRRDYLQRGVAQDDFAKMKGRRFLDGRLTVQNSGYGLFLHRF